MQEQGGRLFPLIAMNALTSNKKSVGLKYILLRIRRKLLAGLELLSYTFNRSAQQVFVVVSCERNAGDYALRCLKSVYSQRYDKMFVKHVFIDDASDDGTHEKIMQWLEEHPGHCVEYLHRQARLGGTYNTLDGFRQAEPEAVVIELNGDDWLPDNKVLGYMSRVYADEKVWMTYNTLRVHNGPPVPWARKFPQAVINQNAFRDQTEWSASHLHTFRKGLFDHLDEETFIDPLTGDYWECADDQAIYLGMLELAGQHSRHLNRVTCVYNFWEASHSFHDNDKSVAAAERIRQMDRYQPLKQL